MLRWRKISAEPIWFCFIDECAVRIFKHLWKWNVHAANKAINELDAWMSANYAPFAFITHPNWCRIEIYRMPFVVSSRICVLRCLDRPLDADIMPKMKHVCRPFKNKIWNFVAWMVIATNFLHSHAPCTRSTCKWRVWCENYRYFRISDR